MFYSSEKAHEVKATILAMEGLDGVGKSTLGLSIAQWLSQFTHRQITFVKSHVIDSVTQSIREIILSEKTEQNSELMHLLLVMAQRQRMLDSLYGAGKLQDPNQVIIFDRYVYSTWVLQGLVDGLQPTLFDVASMKLSHLVMPLPGQVNIFLTANESLLNRRLAIRRLNGHADHLDERYHDVSQAWRNFIVNRQNLEKFTGMENKIIEVECVDGIDESVKRLIAALQAHPHTAQVFVQEKSA